MKRIRLFDISQADQGEKLSMTSSEETSLTRGEIRMREDQLDKRE
jgi:hypothetical protein